MNSLMPTDIWYGSHPSRLGQLRALGSKLGERFIYQHAFNNMPGAFVCVFDYELKLIAIGGDEHPTCLCDKEHELVGLRISELTCIFNGYTDTVNSCCSNALRGVYKGFTYKNNNKSYLCKVGSINIQNSSYIIITSYDISDIIA